MKSILLATLLSLTGGFFAGANPPQPLSVDMPDTWELKHSGAGKMHFYSGGPKANDTSRLFFRQLSDKGTVDQIPEVFGQLIKKFTAQVNERMPAGADKTVFEIEKFEGPTFSGNFVRFPVGRTHIMTIFIIGDDQALWQGQFLGTSREWSEAGEILRNLKTSS